MRIFRVVTQVSPRKTTTAGFFTNEATAIELAAATPNSTVESVEVSEATDLADYQLSQKLEAVRAILTSDEFDTLQERLRSGAAL
jgi:hypothetical protein